MQLYVPGSHVFFVFFLVSRLCGRVVSIPRCTNGLLYKLGPILRTAVPSVHLVDGGDLYDGTFWMPFPDFQKLYNGGLYCGPEYCFGYQLESVRNVLCSMDGFMCCCALLLFSD